MELGAKGIMKIEFSQQEVANNLFLVQAAGVSSTLGSSAYKKVIGLSPKELNEVGDFVSTLARVKLSAEKGE